MSGNNFFRSRLIIPVIVVGLLVVALLSPVSLDGRYGDPRLSTNVAGPLGARGLFETVVRLGWRAERQITPGFAALDSTAIFAVLSPPVALSEVETGVLLGRVRDGGALLAVIEDGTPLADSLRLSTAGSMTVAPVAPVADTTITPCPVNETRSALRFLRGRVYVTPFSRRTSMPQASTIFLTAESPASSISRIPVAIGFPLGRGRVAAVSDANVLRNDVIRVCRWNAGFAAVRMIEYLSRESRRRIIFDEFHQGFGQQPDVNAAIMATLTSTPPGRAIAQLALAAIVLLAAVGPRPISPQPQTRVERRSPFEHVDALATAYGQARATQLATQRLVRGLRRRLAGNESTRVASSADDSAFLEAVAKSHPELSEDVAGLLQALEHPVADDVLVKAGLAIEHIERKLNT